jgi:hypothetical protein
MAELLHRIKIFVYRFQEERPDYLLLRAAGHESFWGPLQGPLGFGEKLESAIRREVLDDVGLARPADLIDLQMPGRWILGDEEVIEWNFGFRSPPGDPELSLGPRWADYVWADFSRAYPSLELDGDRAAILRLHTLLRAA